MFYRILDTSVPGQIGTCVRLFGTKTNRHPDNSAPQKDNSALVFFSLILVQNFQILIMSSGKDPYSVLPPVTTIPLECFLLRADNTVTLYTTVIWHCEIERSFSAPSILSCFWAFTQNFLNMACTRFRKEFVTTRTTSLRQFWPLLEGNSGPLFEDNSDQYLG